MDELSETDKLTVERARKIQRFLSQPFAVAEVFTGLEGRLVSLKDTVKSFREILDGKHDNLPEAAFYWLVILKKLFPRLANWLNLPRNQVKTINCQI